MAAEELSRDYANYIINNNISTEVISKIFLIHNRKYIFFRYHQ